MPKQETENKANQTITSVDAPELNWDELEEHVSEKLAHIKTYVIRVPLNILNDLLNGEAGLYQTKATNILETYTHLFHRIMKAIIEASNDENRGKGIKLYTSVKTHLDEAKLGENLLHREGGIRETMTFVIGGKNTLLSETEWNTIVTPPQAKQTPETNPQQKSTTQHTIIDFNDLSSEEDDATNNGDYDSFDWQSIPSNTGSNNSAQSNSTQGKAPEDKAPEDNIAKSDASTPNWDKHNALMRQLTSGFSWGAAIFASGSAAIVIAVGVMTALSNNPDFMSHWMSSPDLAYSAYALIALAVVCVVLAAAFDAEKTERLTRDPNNKGKKIPIPTRPWGFGKGARLFREKNPNSKGDEGKTPNPSGQA